MSEGTFLFLSAMRKLRPTGKNVPVVEEVGAEDRDRPGVPGVIGQMPGRDVHPDTGVEDQPGHLPGKPEQLRARLIASEAIESRASNAPGSWASRARAESHSTATQPTKIGIATCTGSRSGSASATSALSNDSANPHSAMPTIVSRVTVNAVGYSELSCCFDSQLREKDRRVWAQPRNTFVKRRKAHAVPLREVRQVRIRKLPMTGYPVPGHLRIQCIIRNWMALRKCANALQ